MWSLSSAGIKAAAKFSEKKNIKVNEVIRAIINKPFIFFFFYKEILHAKKIQIKSTQADMCLKYLKKELFIYLYAFFKAFKRKKSAYKNIWTKITHYIMGLIFCASFLHV